MQSESEVNAIRGDDGAAAVRELRRLYELTEKLEAEAMRVLRGDAAALPSLPEVCGAISACLSVVRSPGDALALRAFADSLSVHGPTGEASPGDAAGRSPARRDWRVKEVNNTMRSYYRCTHGHDRGCQAKKSVQQRDKGSLPTYEVNYVNPHTC